MTLRSDSCYVQYLLTSSGSRYRRLRIGISLPVANEPIGKTFSAAFEDVNVGFLVKVTLNPSTKGVRFGELEESKHYRILPDVLVLLARAPGLSR